MRQLDYISIGNDPQMQFFQIRLYYVILLANLKISLTPSFVQVQLVHGEILRDDPNSMSNPLTRHCVTSSRQ